MAVLDLKQYTTKLFGNVNDILYCPNCGGENLHHDVVETFSRFEDAQTGIHVRIEGGTVLTDSHLSRNPSIRRGGLLIKFWCENCPATPTLGIRQHKGSTYVEFNDLLAD